MPKVAGSTLAAGRDITLTATGAPKEVPLGGTDPAQANSGDITIQGSTLTAARNTFEQHSTNQNSSASVGIGFMVGGTQNGFTIQAGVSGGKGKADGKDTVWTNTHVTAGETLTLQSGSDTTRKGAVASGERVIASTQAAVDHNKNRFQTDGTLTMSDIQNKADYKASSTSVNLGTSLSFDGALKPGGTSAGFGRDSGSASSTTKAGISGVAGNTQVRTGDKESGIKKIFDQDKVQKEIEAQTRITQTFNQLAPKAAADYAGSQVSSLKKQAENETDPEKKAALLNEAKKWSPNGSYNIAMNIIIGAAGGNLNSAATKETLSWAANEMRQNMIKDSETFKGICDTQGNCISNMSGQSAG